MLFSDRSLTAEAAALSRALGAVDDVLPTKCEDHLAHMVVHPFLGWWLGGPRARRVLRWLLERFAPGLYAWHCLRTSYFDRTVRAALERGVRQIVILGAGLDTRATRLCRGRGDVAVYEVDRTANAARKAVALEARGLPCPVERRVVRSKIGDGGDSLARVLAREGLDRAAPVFVLCEGLTMYLEPDALDALFGEIALLAPDVTLAFDFVDPSAREARRGTASFRMRASASAVGEVYRSTLAPAQLPALLERHGLVLSEQLGAHALVEREWGARPSPHPVSACSWVACARRGAAPR